MVVLCGCDCGAQMKTSSDRATYRIEFGIAFAVVRLPNRVLMLNVAEKGMAGRRAEAKENT